MASPAISIIIPAYNHEAFVADAIKSVLNQSFTDFEIIVIDDGSTDSTFDEIKKIDDPRIRSFRQSNIGAAETINRGVDLSQGQYITILNSDDMYHPERLAHCKRYMDERPETMVLSSLVQAVDVLGNPLKPGAGNAFHDYWLGWYAGAIQKLQQDGDFFYSLLQSNFVVSTSNIFLNSRIFQEENKFEDKFSYCHDYAFLLRVLQSHPFGFIHRNLLQYRLHETNTIRHNHFLKRLEIQYAVFHSLNFDEILTGSLSFQHKISGVVFRGLENNPDINFGIRLAEKDRMLEKSDVWLKDLQSQITHAEERLMHTDGIVECFESLAAEKDMRIQERDNQLQRLAKEVEQKDADLQGLTREIQQKDDNLQRLAKEVEQKDADLQGLTREIQQKDDSFQRLAKGIEQKDADLQGLTREIQQKDDNLQRLAKEVEQKDADLQRLAKEVEQKDADFQRLAKEVEQKDVDFQRFAKEVEQKDVDFQRFAKEVEQKDVDFQRLAKEVEQKDDNLRHLIKEIEQKDNSLRRLSDENRQKDEHLHDHAEEINRKNILLSDIGHQIQALKKEFLERQRQCEEQEKELAMKSDYETALKTQVHLGDIQLQEADRKIVFLEHMIAQKDQIVSEKERFMQELFASKGWRWLTRYRDIKLSLVARPKSHADQQEHQPQVDEKTYHAKVLSSNNHVRPKVVHAIANFLTGGSSRLVVDLVEHLGHKYDQEVISFCIPTPLAYAGVVLHDFSGNVAKEQIESFIRQKNAQILHVHYWGEGDAPWYRKVFDAAENWQGVLIENINTPVVPYVCDRVDHFVYVSEYAKNFAACREEKSSVIYPGSNFALFDRKEAPVPDNVIGMVYRLDPDKLKADAIRVFIQVVKKRPQTQVLIVGGGEFFDAYRTQVSEEGASANFEFTGYVPYEKLPEYYQKMSIFVAPVWKESFGQVSPFAMSMKIPVAGYRIGALSEILGSEDLLATDPDELSDIIVNLLEDRDRRIEIGRNNHQRAHERFSVEAMVAAYDRLYDRLIQERSL